MTEITVPFNDRISGPYTATLGQTAFPYDFPIFAAAELTVVRQRAGVETVLVLGVDYTVAGAGDQAGGTVSLVAASLANDVIVIAGATPYERAGNFQPPPNSPSATDFNADLNRIEMQLQELRAKAERAPRLRDTDFAADLRLPLRDDRASKLFGFDSFGLPMALATSGPGPAGPQGPAGSLSAASSVDLTRIAEPGVAGAGVDRFYSGLDGILRVKDPLGALVPISHFVQSGAGAATRTMQDARRDFVSLLDWPTVADADADARPKFVPAGTYDTTLAATALDGPYWGFGQIRDVSANKRAPWFTAIKANKAYTAANENSVETAFNGDFSLCLCPVEHRITGAATLTQPTSGYVYAPWATPHYTFLYNESGHNNGTADNSGRTAATAYRTRVFQVGQGDAVAYNASAFVNSTRSGSTNYLANPAAVLFNGDMTAGQAGVYLNAGEVLLDDGGFDVAGIGWVVNLKRSVTAGAKSAWWAGVRLQSVGSQAADVAYSMSGAYKYGIDFSHAILTGNAAIALKANQRIYGNVTVDANPLGRFPSANNTDWIDYDSGLGGWRLVVANAAVLQMTGAQVTANTALRINGNVGFFNTSPAAKPTVSGSRGGNAALASLLTGLASLGLITDSSSA